MATDNPFLKWSTQPAAAPPAPQTAAVVGNENVFASMAPKTPETPMETWWTTLRGNRIQFQAPHGATKDQVRAAAKAAGVPDPQNRSLQFAGAPEKVPTGPTQEQRDNNYGPVGTSIHAGVDFVAPVVDEIAAGSNAVGRAMTGDFNIGQNYMNNMKLLQERAANSEAMYPGEATGGKVGAFLSTLPIAAEAKILQGANTVGTALRTAPAMAAYSGANAYASNPVEDRWNGVPMAAMLGAGIGAASPFVAKGVGVVANRLDQRLGVTDAVRRGWNYILGKPSSEEELANRAASDVMAARVPQSPSQMRAKAQEMRDLGHEPTLVNVTDESGRGFVGAMARRSGPGRQAAQDAYDARRFSAPERIDRNMQTVIEGTTAGDPAGTATVAELRRPVDQVVSDLTEQRSKDIESALQPIRNDPVPLTPRMFDILNTRDGQQAISQAMRTVTDKPTLDAMRSLQSFVRNADKNIPQGMPASVRDQVVQQLLGKQGMTVDIADRLARKFKALGEGAPSDAQRALFGFGREIRDQAKLASPAYKSAMEQYAGTSSTMNAIDTGSEFLGPNNSDEFVKRAANIDGTSPSPGVPSDQQRAMQAARRTVQAATGENISAAPGVARKIAISPEQGQRNAAMFGPINADKLERMMGMTEKDLSDYAQIAPRTGSQTAIRGQDDEMAAHALTAMGYLKAGKPIQAALHVLHTIGVRDEDATRIVQMATDPAQVDNLINMLEQSYGKQTALKMSRVLGLPVTTATSKAVGGSR